MDTASRQQRLRLGAAELGVAIVARDLERFDRYLDLLLRWNRRVNLTAIESPEGVIDRHFLDSLAIVPHIPLGVRTVLDVGSGGGFPGLPIAMLRPDLEVVLVEPRQRRAAFLRAAVAEVECRATVRGSRGEDMVTGERADLAVSRATLPPDRWVALGLQLATWVGVWTARATDLPATQRISYRLPDEFQGVIELFRA